MEFWRRMRITTRRSFTNHHLIFRPPYPSKNQGKKSAPSRTPNLCGERNRLNGVMYRAALLKGPRIQRNLKCVGGRQEGTVSTVPHSGLEGRRRRTDMFMNLEGGIDVPVDVPKFVSSLFQTEKFLHHCFHTPQGFHSVFGGVWKQKPRSLGEAGNSCCSP